MEDGSVVQPMAVAGFVGKEIASNAFGKKTVLASRQVGHACMRARQAWKMIFCAINGRGSLCWQGSCAKCVRQEGTDHIVERWFLPPLLPPNDNWDALALALGFVRSPESVSFSLLVFDILVLQTCDIFCGLSLEGPGIASRTP